MAVIFTVPSRYIKRKDLLALLSKLFGDDYTVSVKPPLVGIEELKLTARRKKWIAF